MGSPREAYAEVRDDYLLGRGWELRQCPKCSCNYFTKRGIDNCASYSCNGGYTFTEVNSPRQLAELEPFVKSMASCFSSRGFVSTPPIKLLRENERTLFASAAGQVFDPAIYGGSEPSEPKVFVIQPVIRLQKADMVGVIEGFATSFLNAATEQWQTTASEHFESLDNWLDFFSAQGLYIGNLCLEVSQETENWDGRIVEAESLKINYSGLEIAIANFFHGISQANEEATLSDISLGAERLVWAINKTGSYFDAVGPLYDALLGRVAAMDAIRTLTLMSSAGVTAGHKNHGYQFRSLARSRAQHLQKVNTHDLAVFYYSQWARFLEPTHERSAVEKEISSETERNINLEFNELLRTGIDCDQVTEDFLRTVVRKRKSTPDELRAIIRKRGE